MRERRRGEFVISTDRPRILRLQHGTPWGGGMRLATLLRAMANSVCLGVFEQVTLVGFGRAVTDLATYGY